MAIAQSHLKLFYADKRVLVTGCTGFKGAWLSSWLTHLGAEVWGLADGVPTNPSLFESASLAEKIRYHEVDVRNLESVEKLISDARPDIIFHLAAQSLVRRSYQEPVRTFETNVMGTINVLEAVRRRGAPCRVVLITSDKAYDNVEWVWGYREDDKLGGADPYSGSKGAAELAISSYVRSFFSDHTKEIFVGVGRAGNVIGGGDWAEDRIVPDAVRAWSKSMSVTIRNPRATRPWQHVLEPLSGYLALGMRVHEAAIHGEAFNFGPSSDEVHTVEDLLNDIGRSFGKGSWQVDPRGQALAESQLLKLNCDKALHTLGWRSTLSYAETVEFTASWYRDFYRQKFDAWSASIEQITNYSGLACERGREWSK